MINEDNWRLFCLPVAKIAEYDGYLASLFCLSREKIACLSFSNWKSWFELKKKFHSERFLSENNKSNIYMHKRISIQRILLAWNWKSSGSIGRRRKNPVVSCSWHVINDGVQIQQLSFSDDLHSLFPDGRSNNLVPRMYCRFIFK